MGTSFPGDIAGVPNFRVKCPSEFLQSADWGSEWFVAHIFTSSFCPPAHPGCRKCWVWHQVCLTSPLTPPGVVSCCPRRISNSSCLRCSSLEENSGGKPAPMALGRTSQRAFAPGRGQGWLILLCLLRTLPHTLKSGIDFKTGSEPSFPSELCSGRASSGATLGLCWSSLLPGSIPFCTCG